MITKTNNLVLLVDDDERILRFMRLGLKASGYDVVTAMTGEAALAMIESQGPDLVVLDLKMPGMGGLEVLKTLRSRSDLPVIVVSAADQAGEALELGAKAYVPKPFDPDQLLRDIQRTLSGKKTSTLL